MPTLNLSPEEMASRIVRAKTIQPKKKRFDEKGGIPAKAMESIAADSIYLYMAPAQGVGATSQNLGQRTRRAADATPQEPSDDTRSPCVSAWHQ